MHLTRRAYLAGTAALVTARPALASDTRILTAAPAKVQITPAEYGPTWLWCFDGVTPGPELRVQQGGRVRVDFRNDLPQPSAIHWHGIRIDNRMDGVPGLTQTPVEPGETFSYDFIAPDAGTYWYHSHSKSWEQVARGLHGALIIEEPEPPKVDQDLVLVLDDWRLDRDARLSEDFASMRDWSHAGRIGNHVTVNSHPEPTYSAGRNERLRLRLINSANARIFTLSATGLTGWVLALDGQPLSTPEPLDRVTLAPAQRADLLVDVTPHDTATPTLISHERDGDYALATFPAKQAVRASRLPEPPPLPANPLPAFPARAEPRQVDLIVQGGAMGRMAEAEFEGQTLGIRELVQKGYAWAFNGTAGMPKTPLFDVPLGQAVSLKLVNDTAWPHGIHLHGHHFFETAEDNPGAPGPWRDTILLHRGETRRIHFTADNPGDWLIHCHMLEHAAAGMTAWFRVT